MRALSLFVLSVLAPAAFSQTITFEDLPGLSEGDDIQDQFDVAPYWVRFEREVNGVGLPVKLAGVGGTRTAFQGQSNRRCDGILSSNDKPHSALDFDAGCFFLTDDGLVGDLAPAVQPIVVRYTVPVLQASGVLYDIDGNELFRVRALDANGIDVAAALLLAPSGREGEATRWSFGVDEPIHSIRIELARGAGTKGIGFDQFSTASTCPDQVVHRGNGTRGSGGHVPALSLDCPRSGFAGSIQVFNGLGGAHGCLGISFSSSTRRLSCAGLAGPAEWLSSSGFVVPTVLSGPPGVPGVGRFSRGYGSNALAALVGTTVYLQAGVIDSGAACNGFALTEIIEATIR